MGIMTPAIQAVWSLNCLEIVPLVVTVALAPGIQGFDPSYKVGAKSIGLQGFKKETPLHPIKCILSIQGQSYGRGLAGPYSPFYILLFVCYQRRTGVGKSQPDQGKPGCL